MNPDFSSIQLGVSPSISCSLEHFGSQHATTHEKSSNFSSEIGGATRREYSSLVIARATSNREWWLRMARGEIRGVNRQTREFPSSPAGQVAELFIAPHFIPLNFLWWDGSERRIGRSFVGVPKGCRHNRVTNDQ